MIKKLLNIAITMCIVGAASTGILYAIELASGPSIEYYGSVPVQDEYRNNDLIESMTFGKSSSPRGDTIQFTNVLMCYPLDHPLRDFFPIQDRVRTYEDFVFGNDLDGVTDADGRQISYTDAHVIKAVQANDGRFVTWFLDDIRPDFDAECYIKSEATTFTTIFNIPKTITYKGVTFKYFTE